jgi:hypothetical protein
VATKHIYIYIVYHRSTFPEFQVLSNLPNPLFHLLLLLLLHQRQNDAYRNPEALTLSPHCLSLSSLPHRSPLQPHSLRMTRPIRLTLTRPSGTSSASPTHRTSPRTSSTPAHGARSWSPAWPLQPPARRILAPSSRGGTVRACLRCSRR